ncbi:exodeoxyribonuclease V subunit alpha [Deferribacter abyssi]|uniref:exodeoxyribonuclease V subunit alpha n=1 Tax=Deferribacter abyssi TaxID=213806 RepID=UPI003C1E7B7C
MQLNDNFLEKLIDENIITFADYEIYKWIYKLYSSNITALIALLVNYKLRNGDSCLLIDEIEKKDLAEILFYESSLDLKLPDKQKIVDELAKSGLIGNANSLCHLDEKNRLFFKRIYSYEKNVANKLKQLASIKTFFNNSNTKQAPEKDWQYVAIQMAKINQLLVISGGPGTGKTTTVKKIIKNLLMENEKLNIILSAPTGKAVSRLQESLKDDEISEKINPPVTIHKLLGANYTLTRFYYNDKNKLPYDVIIVDEVSMVNLELMHQLLISIKDDAKLILLGDKDQLSSVEAGAIMGEICSFPEIYPQINTINSFSKEYGKKLYIPDENLVNIDNPLIDCTIEFTKNYRFKEDSGIGLLSNAIKNNNFTLIENIISKKISFDDLILIEKPSNTLFDEIVDDYYNNLKDDLLSTLTAVKILTPYRITPFGSEKLNEIIDKKLRKKFLTSQTWYTGRQVIITVNDYQNELFNGDIGICMKKDNKEYIAFLRTGDENYKYLHPSLLPAYDLAFAMTVHKSQGSEFDKVYFFIGQKESDLLNRELIYTAITRARKKIILIGSKELLFNSLMKKTTRKSALSDMLYG